MFTGSSEISFRIHCTEQQSLLEAAVVVESSHVLHFFGKRMAIES